MENQGSTIISTFDSLFTTNQIQMLKILISHLAPGHQGTFAMYIKLMELQYTFTLLQRHPRMQLFQSKSKLSFDLLHGDNEGIIELLEELLPFSSPEERSKIENMKNMMQSMKQMKDMMDMVQMMQEMFPQGAGSDNDGSSPMDMFSSIGNMGSGNGSSPLDLFASMSGMSNMVNENGSSPLDFFASMSGMGNMGNENGSSPLDFFTSMSGMGSENGSSPLDFFTSMSGMGDENSSSPLDFYADSDSENDDTGKTDETDISNFSASNTSPTKDDA